MQKQHQIKRTLEQTDSIKSIRELLGRSGQAHRSALSDSVCRHFGFFDARGATQVSGCAKALREFERAGHFVLPAGHDQDAVRPRKQAAPMKIKTILTDNGSQFTDRFTGESKTPSGQHEFDLVCVSLGIEHRLCPPRHPQTNGMVERFNGGISEIINQTRFALAAELDDTLAHYCQPTSTSSRSAP